MGEIHKGDLHKEKILANENFENFLEFLNCIYSFGSLDLSAICPDNFVGRGEH